MKIISSLKQALTLNFVLAAALPVILFALLTVKYVSNYLIKDVARDNIFLAGELKAQAEDFLLQPVSTLDEIRKILYLGILVSDEGIDTYLEREVRSSNFFESVYILNKQGQVVNLGVSSHLEQQKQDYYSIDLSSHELFVEAIEPGQIFWSDTFISVVTGEPSITIGMPVKEKILVGNLSLKRLNRIVSRFTYAENITFAIIDSKGSLIAHSDPEKALQRVNMMFHPEIATALETKSDVEFHQHEDGHFLESVLTVPETGWLVWVARDKNLVLAPIDNVRNFMLLALSLSIALGIVLAFFNSRKLMRPIALLVDGVDRLAAGNYEIEPTESSYHEINDLTSGMNRMSRAVIDREQSIMEREARFRDLVNSIEGVVWEYDIGLNCYTFVSKHCESLLGCSYQQWLDSPDFWNKHVHPDDRQWVVDYFAGLMQGKLSPQLEYRMMDKSGKMIWVRNMVNVIFESNKPTRMYGVIIDINDRKNSEIALRESELRFRSLVEQAADIILIHDQSGQLVEVNEQACRSYGYSRNELLQMTVQDVEIDHDPVQNSSLWNSVRHGNPLTLESEHRRQDGSQFPVEVRLGSFTFQDAPLYLALVRDISERKMADAALRASEERFRSYFELGLIGMAMTDTDGNWIQFNDRLSEIVGYNKEELLEKKWVDITHPDDLVVDKKNMTELLAGKIDNFSYDKRYVSKTGETVFASVSVTSVKSQGGSIDHVIALVEDISKRKYAEQALQQSEEQVRLLLDSTAEGIYGSDADGICTLCNPAGLEMLGYESESEIVGKNMHALTHHSRIDGSPLAAEDCQILNAVNSLQYAYSDEEVFWRADGSFFHVEYRAHPIVKDDQLIGSVVTFHDITERKQLQKQSVRTAQLASLGELAAGVAHEINNPINGVINYAQILLNRLEKNHLETDLADRIIKEGERIATIVKDLLFFAREGGPEMKLSNIGEILGEALSLTEAQIRKEGILLSVQAESGVPMITTRAQQIQQLFLNILSNARHALNEKFPDRDEKKIIEVLIQPVTKRKKKFVRIAFKDYGAGIDTTMLEKVMNPFVTTKPAGVGTGLGLSISHEIVENHNGTIEIESRQGEWTEVVVELPAAEKVKS